MKRLNSSLIVSLGITSLLWSGISFAAEPVNAVETRLRETLRSTTLQLRDVQTQLATQQAALAEAEQKVKDQAIQVTTLIKQSTSDQDTAKKTIGELRAIGERQNTEIAQLKGELLSWQAAQKQAADVANTRESQRAQLAARIIELDRQVDDQQAKNAALFKVGNEILTRYEKFSLGEALTAREPFVGITRVKLQNLVQDYQDQIVDQKIKP